MSFQEMNTEKSKICTIEHSVESVVYRNAFWRKAHEWAYNNWKSSLFYD